MKTFYFLYGTISTLFAFVMLFNNVAYEFLDDYYIELLSNEYNHAWNYTNAVIIFAFVICSIAWIYHQGILAAKEIAKQYKEEESLINIKEEKENE